MSHHPNKFANRFMKVYDKNLLCFELEFFHKILAINCDKRFCSEGLGQTAIEGQVYMCVPRLLVESLISSPVYRLNFPRSG